jgi:hypothetical protein
VKILGKPPKPINRWRFGVVGMSILALLLIVGAFFSERWWSPAGMGLFGLISAVANYRALHKEGWFEERRPHR